MKHQLLLTTAILLVFGIFLMTAPVAFSATNGQISFNGVVLVEGATCATSSLQINLGWTATTNDGGLNSDFIGYVVVDGAQGAIATGVFGIPVGSGFSFTDSVNLNSINPITYRPLTISMHDIVGHPADIATLPGEERAAAILALSRLAVSTFDPATVLDECAELPMGSPLNAAPLLNYFTVDMPTVAWNRITWALSYDVQIADNSDFTAATIYPVGDVLTFTVPSPLADVRHYWRVRACLATTCGLWSAAQSFMVDAV